MTNSQSVRILLHSEVKNQYRERTVEHYCRRFYDWKVKIVYEALCQTGQVWIVKRARNGLITFLQATMAIGDGEGLYRRSVAKAAGSCGCIWHTFRIAAGQDRTNIEWTFTVLCRSHVLAFSIRYISTADLVQSPTIFVSHCAKPVQFNWLFGEFLLRAKVSGTTSSEGFL